MKRPIPPFIQSYGNTIRDLVRKTNLMGDEKKRLNLARLKIAKWSCECEGLPPSALNLRIALGSDADEAFKYFPDFVSDNGGMSFQRG